MPPFMVEQKKQ